MGLFLSKGVGTKGGSYYLVSLLKNLIHFLYLKIISRRFQKMELIFKNWQFQPLDILNRSC